MTSDRTDPAWVVEVSVDASRATGRARKASRTLTAGHCGRREHPALVNGLLAVEPGLIVRTWRHGEGAAPEPYETVPGQPLGLLGRSARPYTSFVRFGPAPPAACSIGGTSGSADFSSPRKVNFFSSPSPSVPTTTM